MKKYEQTEIEIIRLDDTDIITNSGDHEVTTPELPIGGNNGNNN